MVGNGRPRVERSADELKEMLKRRNERYYQKHRENWKRYNEVKGLTVYDKALQLFITKTSSLTMTEEQKTLYEKCIEELRKIEA
jgi:hypothetical protein